MLQLKDISKSYTTGDFTQKALDGVSLNFRKSEFVAILGQSGSGKTTFLNVIGGLDKYDSGDLVINGKSTKDFTDLEWDAYRNNTIGFIFQSYNLITHLDVLSNVEMGMTLSGMSADEKRKKAIEALTKVGLKEHMHKKPNQLSGGQMQRVAIARALSTDPDIILADEPTGALDTATSKQIMDLIKEIASDKLVIMVTHNPELANEYADRIVKFQDGRVVDDSNPYNEAFEDESYKIKRTSMKFRTALNLSWKNISTKKGRTLLTAFASSIGIIGIALILSLSDGFQQQIDKYQSNALNEFPIVISQMSMNMSDDDIKENQQKWSSMLTGDRDYADTDYVTFSDSSRTSEMHMNNFSDDFMSYVENIDKSVCDNIGYTRLVTINALKKGSDGKASWYNFPSGVSGMTTQSNTQYDMSGVGLSSYPVSTGDSGDSYLEKYYDVLYGAYPTNSHELVLVVDSDNSIDSSTMESLGFDVSGGKMTFKNIVGTEYKIVGNDDFYTKSEYGFYIQNTDYDSIYNSQSNITVKICGVVRLKNTESVGLLGFGLAYSDDLVNEVVKLNSNSKIVSDIKTSDVNVTDPAMTALDDDTRNTLISKYGGSSTPFVIYLYPNTFEMKDSLLTYLNNYNTGKSEDDQIVYIDLSESITSLTGNIMNAVTIVLVAFAAISLVVSLIMIAIITYISVLERTKEIGILRALGARKKDITRVFSAETFIIGITSGLLGIGLAYLLTIPVNIIIKHYTTLENVAQLNPLYALGLVALSLILTMLGGFIPSKMAARKDPVTALRQE